MRPDLTMSMLNMLYVQFDMCCKWHPKAYKLDVIGDSYMVVAGLNFQMDPSPARTLVLLAADLLKVVQEQQHSPSNTPFRVRIGISTGSVAGGVLGRYRRKVGRLSRWDCSEQAPTLSSTHHPSVHRDGRHGQPGLPARGPRRADEDPHDPGMCPRGRDPRAHAGQEDSGGQGHRPDGDASL